MSTYLKEENNMHACCSIIHIHSHSTRTHTHILIVNVMFFFFSFVYFTWLVFIYFKWFINNLWLHTWHQLCVSSSFFVLYLPFHFILNNMYKEKYRERTNVNIQCFELMFIYFHFFPLCFDSEHTYTHTHKHPIKQQYRISNLIYSGCSF